MCFLLTLDMEFLDCVLMETGSIFICKLNEPGTALEPHK